MNKYLRLVKSFGTKNIKHPIQSNILINGKFVKSVSGKTYDNINPSTEEVIAKVQEGGKEDIDLAVKAAREAFDNGVWRRTPPSVRGRIMYKLADLIEKNIDELAALESLDNGKPFLISKNVDLQGVIGVIRYYAGWTDKVHGQVIPSNSNNLVYTLHEPVGVVGQIIPWNFPLMMASWKIGPALAMGCTIVMKPAEQTPLTCLKLGELALEAGLPEGVFNVVPGFGPTAGGPLADHPLVDKIAFTGSSEVGLHLIKNSHSNNLKRITLELGGKSPNIIFDDADVDLAVKQANLGLFFNNGQCCSAGSRTYVHEKIYDEFVEKSIAAAKKIKVGDPFKEDTEHGPQIDIDQRNKYEYYIKKGVEEGAKLHFGGNVVKGKGYFVEPTVFSNVNDSMAISREEIFGPVMSIHKFKTVDEVIKRANNSLYGLAAGVVTRNTENALKVAHGLRAGTVYVNTYHAFDVNTPFGGFKNSGIGRDLGEYALQNYTEVKTVIVKKGENSL